MAMVYLTKLKSTTALLRLAINYSVFKFRGSGETKDIGV